MAWDDYINHDMNLAERRKGGSVFANTTTEPVEIIEIRSVHKFMVLGGLGEDHYWMGNYVGMVTVEIHEPTTDCIMNLSEESGDGYIHHPTHYTGRRLFCYSSHEGLPGRLRIWKLENNTLISTHDSTRMRCGGFKMVAVDEKFLLGTFRFSIFSVNGESLHFFYPETFEQVRMLGVCLTTAYIYERGLLFLRREKAKTTGYVRIMDVASGTWFNNGVRSPLRTKANEFLAMESSKSISFNSSVIVIAWEYRDPGERSLVLTNFSVYDLEVVKNATNRNGCCSPL